jgi:hypothetical protein
MTDAQPRNRLAKDIKLISVENTSTRISKQGDGWAWGKAQVNERINYECIQWHEQRKFWGH